MLRPQDAGYTPINSWVGADASTDASGHSMLCLAPGGERLGVLHFKSCRFRSEDHVTSLTAAAAWHPHRTMYAAFSQRASRANDRRVVLFSCEGKVRMLQAHLSCRTPLRRQHRPSLEASMRAAATASADLRLAAWSAHYPCTSSTCTLHLPLPHS